jgi:PTS system mannose-specific IIA component
MMGLLVITHGCLAEELVAATRRIVGDVERLEGISIDWDDDVDDARTRIVERIGALDAGAGVLVLTDMFGGTPTNLALSLLEPGKVEIITGVNLPMLIKFTNLRERTDLDDVARKIADQGRHAIHVASEVLSPPAGDPS